MGVIESPWGASYGQDITSCAASINGVIDEGSPAVLAKVVPETSSEGRERRVRGKRGDREREEIRFEERGDRYREGKRGSEGERGDRERGEIRF